MHRNAQDNDFECFSVPLNDDGIWCAFTTIHRQNDWNPGCIYGYWENSVSRQSSWHRYAIAGEFRSVVCRVSGSHCHWSVGWFAWSCWVAVNLFGKSVPGRALARHRQALRPYPETDRAMASAFSYTSWIRLWCWSLKPVFTAAISGSFGD